MTDIEKLDQAEKALEESLYNDAELLALYYNYKHAIEKVLSNISKLIKTNIH